MHARLFVFVRERVFYIRVFYIPYKCILIHTFSSVLINFNCKSIRMFIIQNNNGSQTRLLTFAYSLYIFLERIMTDALEDHEVLETEQ